MLSAARCVFYDYATVARPPLSPSYQARSDSSSDSP
jgi:hypothetical protein